MRSQVNLVHSKLVEEQPSFEKFNLVVRPNAPFDPSGNNTFM